jgi:hypothetical protein
MKTLYFNPETKVIFASEDAQDAAIQTIQPDAVPDLIANGATVDSSADNLVGNDSAAAGGVSSGEQSQTASVEGATGTDAGEQGNVSGDSTATAAVGSDAGVAATGDAGNAAPDAPVPDASANTSGTAGEQGNAAPAAEASADAGTSGTASDAKSTSSAEADSAVPLAAGGAATNDPTTPATIIPTTNTPVASVAAVPGDGTVGTGPGAEVNTGDPAQVNAAVGAPAPLSTGTTVDVTQVDGHPINSNVQNGNELAGSNPAMVTDDNAQPVPVTNVPAGGNVLVNDTPTLDAPAVDGDTKTLTNVETQLNPLVPAAGTEGPPATQLAAQAEEPEVEPLSRDSHLMLLEAKFAIALAKLRNAERVAAEELDAIWQHVKAVI